MSPEFASAVDPVFLKGIDLLERIGRNQAESVRMERDALDRVFREAEAILGNRPDWQLAKYALVAWMDESLKAAPWDGSGWWKENSLEFACFQTNDAAVEFFVRARQAGQLPRRDALEVFYVCAVLGFRGMYELEERAFLADHLKLEANVEDWATAISRAIQLGEGRTRLQDTSRPIDGAPPIDGHYQLLLSLFWLIVLLIVLPVLAFFLLWPGNRDSAREENENAGAVTMVTESWRDQTWALF